MDKKKYMAGLTQAERMVKVETNLENLTTTVHDGLGTINATLKDIKDNYLLKAEHEKQIAVLAVEIKEAKRKNSLQVWITSTMAAIFGVIMTVLLQSFFSK
jgi:uncharacterized oligopeptide transporter (OPT) family protein